METIGNAFLWSGHHEHIKELLKSMFFQKYNTDVTFITEDNKRIEAHKAILSSCSPLLKNILEQATTIYLSEIRYAEFESVLKFIYLGEVVVEKDELTDFLDLGSKLQMNELIDSSTRNKCVEKVNLSDSTNEKSSSSTLSGQVVVEKEDFNNFSGLKSKLQMDSSTGNCVEKEKFEEDNIEQSLGSTDKLGTEDLNIPAAKAAHLDKEKEYFCNQCNYFSKISEDLESHKLSIHCDSLQEIKTDISCWECGKVFKRKDNLQRHYKAHEKQKKTYTFTCPTCNLGISTERNLKEHMKLHDINQCYLCDKCDYKSPVLNILKRHKMTVHNENKFSCINCDYKATYELHLKRHVNYYHKEQRNV